MKKSLFENFLIKSKCLVLTFLVSFSLFVCENALGYKYFKDTFITVKRVPHGGIVFDALVYDYSSTNLGFLAECKIEGCNSNNVTYYTIFEFKTPEQKPSGFTNIILKNKLPNAEIFFQGFKSKTTTWPEEKRESFLAAIINNKDLAVANLSWYPDDAHTKVADIQISGKWKNGTHVENFVYIINLNKPMPRKMTQSDEQKENTDRIDDPKDINTIEVYGESDAVIVKGAEDSETIKVCNESGVEVKTVVANKSGSRIELPAKQLYFIYIGEKKFKVAL